MSILIRQAGVECREQTDGSARPIVLVRLLGPIRLDVVLFSAVAYCIVLAMQIFAAQLISSPQGSNIFMVVWHSFLALFAMLLTYALLHHIALEEELIVSRDSTMRHVLLGGRVIRRQALAHADGVEIDTGRICRVSRVYTEVNGAITGMDEQPHGLILRSGGHSLWVGRKLWAAENRLELEEAVRAALHTCQAARVAGQG